MKTTILGIKVSRCTVNAIKHYMNAKKANKDNIFDWNVGYSLAKAESAAREENLMGKITKEEEKIIATFIHNIEFPKLRRSLYEPKDFI